LPLSNTSSYRCHVSCVLWESVSFRVSIMSEYEEELLETTLDEFEDDPRVDDAFEL